MADYKITRMEFINLKQKIKLAKKGHDLLKKKRDALISEFMALLKETSSLREELDRVSMDAVSLIAIAEAIEGGEALESASLAVKSDMKVTVKTRNVMGVVIPVVNYEGDIKREYGMIGTSVKLDEAAEKYSELVKKAVELSKYEIAIKKLLDETEKTKRRVNALEYVIIPKMQDGAKYVRMRLDEMERDDFFRLKMVKKKLSGGK